MNENDAQVPVSTDALTETKPRPALRSLTSAQAELRLLARARGYTPVSAAPLWQRAVLVPLMTVVTLFTVMLALTPIARSAPIAHHPAFPPIVAPPRAIEPPFRIPRFTGFALSQPPPALTATAAFAWDTNTDRVWGLNDQQRLPMASTTKIMTAIVALERGNPDQIITAGSEIEQLTVTDASRMCCPTLAIGQRYTLRELLEGLLLPSGDDAALVIATAISGSPTAFVAEMNKTAVRLHLFHTHFTNPHGLDAPDHVTSARDLAILTSYALTFPLFRTIVASAQLTVPANETHPAIHLVNTNTALRQPGIEGVKTGFTGNAGYCVVLERDGIIAVILGAPDDATRFRDALALLQWAASG